MPRLAPIILLCATGCVEFVALPPQPPAFALSVQFSDSTHFSATVSATLRIGVDPDGRPHTLEDATLRLGSVTLQPDLVTPGARRYQAAFSGAAAVALYEALRAGTLTPPVIAGIPTPAIDLGLPLRAQPPSWSRSADALVLDTGLDDAAPPTPRTFWILQVLHGPGVSLSLSRPAATPRTFSIPDPLGDGPCQDHLTARFDSRRGPPPPDGPSPFPTSADAFITLHWQIPCP